ncbi:Rqc2 family fibronectin-binding protein [Megasphaera elsdenii]|jgi:predicted ribosome quality control (RQC) complex YloA/Tae2 family protein|uniref:Rqc2 family fibronectin-binding protein n=1 Tax=Megasphaera elsdenii TaxID=907 RepID=UPI003F801CE8
MNLDGITLHCITNELADILKGGQISKIYQLDARSLYFRVFNDTGIHHLVITLDDSPRLYVADTMPPTPDIPTGLCMFLRKYYENGRIASIAQLHLDRLIEIAVDVLDMSGRLVTRKIHVELMGKYSNVIFTEDGTIIEALIKTGKNKQALRTIAPKEPYAFPPNFMRMDPFAFSAQELTDMMETGTDEPLKTWMLKRFNGMSTIVLNELSYDSGIDAARPVGELSLADRFAWCRTVEAFGKRLEGMSGAYVYTVKGKEVIFPLELHSLAPYPRRHFSLIETYLSEYQATHRSLNGEQEQLQKKVGKLIEKQKRKIKRIASEMKETKKMDTYKLYGDLLMIYAYEKHDHEKEVTVQNLLSEAQEKVTIPLNPAYSMTDNANRYYKRYTKMRNRKQMSAQLHEENQKHLDYLYSLEYALENTSTKDEIADIKAEMKQMNLISGHNRDKLKKESAQDILTLKADGLDIWVGRNNRQNDFLTLKKAHPYDLWFHVKNQPGSHVILACHNVTPTDAQIERAAQLAAYYSKARESSKVEVDCTLVRHVKKPAHAVPGYVIFTDQTTYMVEPKK